MMRFLGKLIQIALGAVFVLLMVFLLFRYRYQQPIRELSEILIKNITSDIINAAVNGQIENSNVRYDRIVYFEKDLDGRITALKTNMCEVNRLKTDVLSRINDEILAIDSEKMGIAMGNLVFPEIFGGKGPLIPVEILSIRNSDADFYSSFSEAGINQTLQRITMDVQVDVAVLVLGKTDHFRVNSQVVIAETVIVGRVPDTFFHIGGNYGEQRENLSTDKNTE